MPKIEWADEDEKHYEAAEHYLALLFNADQVLAKIRRLTIASISEHRTNDVLRASGLPLLSPDDPNVRKDLKKIGAHLPLEPVLLVRGNPLIIADGYHRVCAIYHTDPDETLKAKLA